MQTTETLIDTYVTQLCRTVSSLPKEPLFNMIDMLQDARATGKHVFIFGNGGSASTASHMVCDFGKNTRREGLAGMKVVGLNDNMATFSAYANDEGYISVFSQPLKSLANAGDICIAISGSGSSPNVIQGVKMAREMGLSTIGLTGFDGGLLKDFVDVCLIVPSDSMEQIEDVHLILDHILTIALREL